MLYIFKNMRETNISFWHFDTSLILQFKSFKKEQDYGCKFYKAWRIGKSRSKQSLLFPILCPMSHILCTLCTLCTVHSTNSTNIPNKVPLIEVWIWAMKMWTIVSLLQTIPPGCNSNELSLPVGLFTIYRKLIWYF